MDEFTWIPDWNPQEGIKANVSKVQFGDGYVQRQTKGMNPLTQTWNLTFSARTDSEASAIMAFLKARKGVTAFTWTPPDEDQAKFTCDNFSRQKAANDNQTVSAVFELVYEP